MIRTTIRARLIKTFSVVILIPSLTTALVGVMMIRSQVLRQAQARVTSDLEAAREIYQNRLDRLEDGLRIHATRRVVYSAFTGGSAQLAEEMDRIRAQEGLDVLTLLDAHGRVHRRAHRPDLAGDSLAGDPLVRRVLDTRAPLAGTLVVDGAALARESPELARRAHMTVTPTPKALPTSRADVTAGMMLEAAAPVLTPEGRVVGILVGGVLLNRDYEIVDKVRKTVFKEESYRGLEVGTATIFQDDVRISTNVKNGDGSRAITTRASAEVARAVLTRGETYHGRAFVVNNWYITAYAPIHDLDGRTIGMLYVGALEQPYIDSLRRQLYVLLGITFLGVLLVSLAAVVVAQRISRPMRAMATAAQGLARGDYDVRVEAATDDEIGYLAESFNRMTEDLARAHRELRDFTTTLERKVEARTAELRAMQAHMLHAEKLAAVGKLAAGVAHEINNPLTGVLTNASLLLTDLPPADERRPDVQTIVDETMRCRRIVKGLLEFSRQTMPHKQPLALGDVVEDVLQLVRNQASFRDIAVETELRADLPPVMADRDQMRQVILNLVLNAADAMPRGGGLTIRARHDAAAGHVILEVADTGPGIPEDIRDRLFEPFFTTKKAGTGLGLSIVYGILEQHRGSIEVRSEVGEGTTMRVVLPADGAAT